MKKKLALLVVLLMVASLAVACGINTNTVVW